MTADNAAYCWGARGGAVGDGTDSTRLAPVAVLGGLKFATLSAGNVTCGLTTAGAAYCWGENLYYELGTGSVVGPDACFVHPGSDGSSCSMNPVAVAGGLTFSTISTGYLHSCGITPAGVAYCWGDNNYGESGFPSTVATRAPVPTAVTGGLTFASLSAGLYRTCGLTAAGTAYCWGAGPLGNGVNGGSGTPVAVSGGLTFIAISAGSNFACGLAVGGSAYCWGQGGLLGDGTNSDRLAPVAVAGGLHFQSLSAGSYQTCALTSDGTAYCWGYNFYGELGDGTTTQRLTPVAVAGGVRFAIISAGIGYGPLNGASHTCGLTPGGTMYCWGLNDQGQLGDSTTMNRLTPVPVKFPEH